MENLLSKTLITGASGMVGSYVDFGIKTNSQQLDIIDFHETLKVIKRYNPKVVLHLAAETDVDLCERDPEHAYMVNSVGTQNILIAAHTVHAKVVYVSTAGVFDGSKSDAYRENDTPNPQNHYSRSKFLGEKLLNSMFDDFLIVRPGWMFGGGPKKDHKFVGKVISLLSKGEIKAVNDKTGSPTYAKDLIVKIKELILNNEQGIMHVANSGVASRYDMATVIARTLRPNTNVTSVDSSFFPQGVARINTEAITSLKVKMRPWEDALQEYLRTEWSNYED